MSEGEPRSLRIAVLTISDTRTEATDTSGKLLVERLSDAGHKLEEKAIVPDHCYRIREIVSRWIADESVGIVITTGGTGLTGRDGTPEAVRPLFDKEIAGFGELFRWLSYEDIGSAALLSRAVAGLARGRVVFVIPGSRGAVQLALEKLILPELGHLAAEAVKTR